MQCKSGNCTLAGGTDCKTCGKALLPLGSACTYSLFECEYGLQCVNSKCVRAVDTGSPCSTDLPCWFASACISGTCVPLAQKGEACDTLLCDGRKGLVCDSTKKCVDVVLAKVGETCGPPNCNADGRCRATSDVGTAGVCVARAADGAACDLAAGVQCLPGSACLAGKCTLFDASSCK